MTFTAADLPTPAWRLKEISVTQSATFLIFKYATYRTNEELFIWVSEQDGKYVAQMSGTEGKDVTNRLSQERWAEIYQKVIAAKVLLGRKPEMIEEIF